MQDTPLIGYCCGRWARVYLARLCAAFLYGEWTSATDFAKGKAGGALWRMLTLLATR